MGSHSLNVETRMRKNRVIGLLVVTAFISFAVILLVVLLPAEPSYQGRRLSAWLDELPTFTSVSFGAHGESQVVWPGGRVPAAAEAIQHIGTNSVPYLARIMQAHDGEWRKRIRSMQLKLRIKSPLQLVQARKNHANCALYILGEVGVPAWQELVSNPSNDLALRMEAARILGSLPNRWRDSAPLLLQAMVEIQDVEFRLTAARSIRSFYSSGTLSVLLSHLKSGNIPMQLQVLTVFQKIGPPAKEAAPALLACMNSASPEVRSAASFALNAVDPEDLSARLFLVQHAPLSRRLTECWVLGRTASAPERAVPVLVECLGDAEAQVREAAAQTLGKYGTNAKPAIPALEGLFDDPKKYVRIAATNALQEIQAENK
jgi:HEAT repeat protein